VRSEAGGDTTSQSGPSSTFAPTWRSSVNRALVASGIFFALLVLLFGQPVGSSVALSAFMLLLYIPMGYGIDKFFYNRRMASKRKAKEARGG